MPSICCTRHAALGECVSRGGGRHDDKPNVFFSHTCHFQRFQRPGSSSSRRFHPQRRCDVADTGTRDDPFVRGIHHFFQISIGAHLYGQITPVPRIFVYMYDQSLLGNTASRRAAILFGTCRCTACTALFDCDCQTREGSRSAVALDCRCCAIPKRHAPLYWSGFRWPTA